MFTFCSDIDYFASTIKLPLALLLPYIPNSYKVLLDEFIIIFSTFSKLFHGNPITCHGQ